MESSRGQVWGAHRLQLVVRRKSCVPLFVAWASFMQALPGIVDRVPQCFNAPFGAPDAVVHQLANVYIAAAPSDFACALVHRSP
eukprot:1139377-Pelagomonas_calceolata.AAC.4